MILVCNKCGRKYFEPRGVCKCGGDEFHQEDGEPSKVECVKLFVTPSGFPEQIEYCLSSINGVKVFEVMK
ncbi:hypothetical protein [Metallosphaera sp.]|uniref:hypothetical protein n=1 Tax=Metallosphaera sp. TaxID=2020860 RepID=UPI003161D36B